ncbi:DNA-3-methyladenine glycosylase family protein [Kribbella sp. NPDC055071]
METPEEYLGRVDPVLGGVIDGIVRADGAPLTMVTDPSLPTNPNIPTGHYAVLVRAIVGQNISTTSAAAIFRRLVDRFGGQPPTPAELLADDPDELRTSAGLSHAKTTSLRSLAEHIISGELELDRLQDLPDEEVIGQLVAIKGIGRWTADIFLIFHLRRPDVLAVGDLEIRKAIAKSYGLPALPSLKEAETLGQIWSPYRTLAGLYLWRLNEGSHAT